MFYAELTVNLFTQIYILYNAIVLEASTHAYAAIVVAETLNASCSMTVNSYHDDNMAVCSTMK